MLHVEKVIELFGNQTEMAKTLGVDKSAISHWKRRRAIPTKQLLNIRDTLKQKKIVLDINSIFVD